MKAYLNLEFDNRTELDEYMRRQVGTERQAVIVPAATPVVIEAEFTTSDVQPETPQKTRKPRSDAGQPRGPYKTSDKPAETVSDQQGPAVAASVAAPAPTITPPATPGAALTVVEARAALKRIHDTKGLGPEACIKHIQEFGVQAISKLPETMFAAFILKADEKVAAAGAKKA